MREHEKKQQGESPEDFARRIVKLPILTPNTILRVVFPAASMSTLQYIKECARAEFPKAFPPEDSKGLPFIEPEDISTKGFAKWVAEKNMFEVLIDLGEKPSPTAKLFIDLVNTRNLLKIFI